MDNENDIIELKSENKQIKKDIENLQKEMNAVKEKQEDLRVTNIEVKADIKNILKNQEKMEKNQEKLEKNFEALSTVITTIKEELKAEMYSAWDGYRKDIITKDNKYKDFIIGAVIGGFVYFVFSYLKMR